MGVIADFRARAVQFLAPAPAKPEETAISAGRYLADPSVAYLGLLGNRVQNGDNILRTKGGGQYKLWRDIYDDERVFTTFQQRTLGMVSRDWTVEPGADDAPSKAAADFVSSQLDRIGFDRVTGKIHFGVFFGFGVGECMWDVTADGLIGLAQVVVPKIEWFGYNTAGELVIIDAFGLNSTPVPERKFWHYSAGASDDFSPYGIGIAHWLYWPVFFKRGGLPMWLKFLERFATPTVVGKTAPGHLDDDAGRKRVLNTLRAFTGATEIAVPDWMEVELVAAAAAGDSGYERLITYCDQCITRVILGQTMTTEDGSSKSQATVHLDVRDEIVAADADLLCESFNRGPATWLTEWNFPGATPPRVYRVMDDPEDLDARATRDTALLALGWEHTDESFISTYGDGYQRTPTAPVQPIVTAQAPNTASLKPAFSAGDLDMVDRIVADMRADGSTIMASFAAALQDKLRGVDNPEAARLILTTFADEADTTAFAELLAKAGIAARGVAEAGVSEGAVR